ncbi:MAG: cytochrome [Acidobacteriota bacterium]
MSYRIIVGIMGPGEGASEEEMQNAFELGSLIAKQKWVLLTGGGGAGVMDAAARGAKAEGGTVVGILPGADTSGLSGSVDIPIVTGMHDARNSINVLSSQALFFVGMNPGTASELSLALKYRKPSILVCQKEAVIEVFRSMRDHCIETADTPSSAIAAAKKHLTMS